MKKILIFAILLLNLLPNIEDGSMRIGISTISAQMMGSESIVYRCNDDDIGWYTSPVPCDDEPCTTACLVYNCEWNGPCEDLGMHDLEFHTAPNSLESEDYPDLSFIRIGGNNLQRWLAYRLLWSM